MYTYVFQVIYFLDVSRLIHDFLSLQGLELIINTYFLDFEFFIIKRLRSWSLLTEIGWGGGVEGI
jgi:hypothetical protein